MNFFSFLLDLLSPRFSSDYSSIHSYISEHELTSFKPHFKELNRDQKKLVDKIFISGKLGNSSLSNLIHRAKYNSEFSIGYDLAGVIKYQILKTKIELPDVITWVPADPKRLVYRNFHLPKIIAKALSSSLNIDNIELLQKNTSTIAQTGLSRAERVINLKDTFDLKTGINLRNIKKIWIIDDVVTTGSTLFECSKVIKKEFKKLKVECVVVGSTE